MDAIGRNVLLTGKIIEAVKEHTGDCIQYDDMTLVIKKSL
jgi:serine phosphatase RsbU (regulator of sigma subunit)